MYYRIILTAAFLSATGAASAPINFNNWQPEGTSSASNWLPNVGVLEDAFDPTSPRISNQVVQTINGLPTVFLSDIDGIAASNTIFARVDAGAGDDDFFGFVIGFQSGDFANPVADYLLVDWKKVGQVNFDAFIPAGLRLSRVTGTPSEEDLWRAIDADPNDGSGVEQLAVGRARGSTGWIFGREYQFDFTYGVDSVDPTKMRFGLSVCEAGTCVQEFDQLLDAPIYGSFGFYTYSQGQVIYRSTSVDGGIAQYVPLPGTAVQPVPLPASGMLLLGAVAGVAGWRRKRRGISGG
ncbi:MAG: hypothetical protein ABJL99_23095 [Aliishimia sp.]